MLVVSAALKKEAEIQHPLHEDLSFLVGTMFTDGKDDYSEEETAMICVFADKQVYICILFFFLIEPILISCKLNCCMKSLNKTETPIFNILCMLCFQGQPF